MIKLPYFSSIFSHMLKYLVMPLQIVSFVLLAVLSWRIASLHMAEHVFSTNLIQDTVIDETLRWNGNHSEALLRRALANEELSFEEGHLNHLLNIMPYDARIYAILARQYSFNGSVEVATELMKVASSMAPQRSDVRLDAAAYWLNHGDPIYALGFIDSALSNNTVLYNRLFPVLLQFLERDDLIPHIEELFRSDRAWVVPFLIFAIDNSKNLDLIRTVIERYEASQTEMSHHVQAALIRRLQKDNLWGDAYFAWLSNLSDVQLLHAGYVFNGGFEVSPSAGGFDWIISKAPGVEVRINAASGVGNSTALSVRFLGLKTAFKHVFQYMVLSPGSYNLRGRVKLDDLRAFKGVQWEVICKEGARTLGASDTFKGQGGWRSFETTFSVPESGCPVQLLRLKLVGQVALDFHATGCVCFDDIAITKLD